MLLTDGWDRALCPDYHINHCSLHGCAASVAEHANALLIKHHPTARTHEKHMAWSSPAPLKINSLTGKVAVQAASNREQPAHEKHMAWSSPAPLPTRQLGWPDYCTCSKQRRAAQTHEKHMAWSSPAPGLSRFSELMATTA